VCQFIREILSSVEDDGELNLGPHIACLDVKTMWQLGEALPRLHSLYLTGHVLLSMVLFLEEFLCIVVTYS
jgi:hypothetical protein